MVREKDKEISLFNERLKKTLNVESTFSELKREGLITFSIHFFRKHCSIQSLIDEIKKKEIKILNAEIKKLHCFNKAFEKLKNEGRLTFSTTFYKQNVVKVKCLNNLGKDKEGVLLVDYATKHDLSIKQAYDKLKKEGKLSFSYDTLRLHVNFNKKQNLTLKRAQKIVNDFNKTNFEGRIMTKEVENAFKLLEL